MEWLLGFAAVCALFDWWAVGTGHRRMETVAKPATMAALVAVATTWGDPSTDIRLWLVVGALLGLVGDIALLGDGESAFMVGLAAFAVGHIAYAVAAFSGGVETRPAIAGAVVVAALLSFRFLTRTLPGARSHGGDVLAGAVMVYAAVIALMVIGAWGTGQWAAAIGSLLFAISDWVLGHRRFVGPLPGGRLAVHVPYHVGQALLVIGIAGA